MKIQEVFSERLILKPLGLDHLSEEYVSWLNDTEVNRYLETKGGYTLKKLSEFLQDVEEKNILFWAIHIKENSKHIGNIKIDPVKNGIGEYGILIGDRNEWGKSYGKEATEAVLNFCFDHCKLRKITLGVISANIQAVQLYKKLGFIQEGLFKYHSLHEGKYCDVIRMAIFNSRIYYGY